MDVRQLRYFLAVVDCDGFGRAAKKLHVAQPSLSQSIAGLERELGVQLFHRDARGVVLSSAGVELAEHARDVLRRMNVASEAIKSIRGLERGTVDLVSMPAPAIEPLSTLMRRFRSQYPDITVKVGAGFTPDEVFDQLRQGTPEIGLVGVSEPLKVPGIEVFSLEQQPFVVLGSQSSGLPDGGVVPPAVLVGEGLIESPGGSLMRRIVDDLIAEGTEVQIVAEVSHRTSVLPLVLQGVGLAVVPSAWAPVARAAGARVARLDVPSRLDVVLASRSGPLTPAAKAFLAIARAYRPSAHLDQEQSGNATEQQR
ncbi:LysR family transcriptional regulator [Saccharopolyspora sp. NPDC049357]|uniref:LysR family transcriptional regulator n=1 Tax=Saccharopolyspora sp. NPDC049357 TaxID=3154507 RepID=UPI003432CB97